jgi:hypothetical protein
MGRTGVRSAASEEVMRCGRKFGVRKKKEIQG